MKLKDLKEIQASKTGVPLAARSQMSMRSGLVILINRGGVRFKEPIKAL